MTSSSAVAVMSTTGPWFNGVTGSADRVGMTQERLALASEGTRNILIDVEHGKRAFCTSVPSISLHVTGLLNGD